MDTGSQRIQVVGCSLCISVLLVMHFAVDETFRPVHAVPPILFDHFGIAVISDCVRHYSSSGLLTSHVFPNFQGYVYASARYPMFAYAKAVRMNHDSNDDDQIMVSRPEAARRLSLSVREIDEARRRGDLAAQRYGGKILISVEELRRFAANLPSDGA